MHARQRYTRLSAESVLIRLRDAVSRRDQRLDELYLRMATAAERRLRVPTQRLNLLAARLRRQDITVRIATTQRRLQHVTQHLQSIATQTITTRQTRLNRATARLEALSPLAVLNRGYALVYAADGTLLRSSSETALGEIIQARLSQGTLTATVTQTKMPEADATEKRTR